MSSAEINGSATPDYEEITIPVPWGHISGKWWGPITGKPIVAIHGWQDNAGSFDRLAPILASRGHSILCIDLPGHGQSSHISEGHYYHIFWDGVHILRRVIKHFEWPTVSLIGHSLGGAIGFLYSAIYPEEVEKYISIDIASPSVRDPKKMVDIIGVSVDKFLKYEKLTMEQMPCYDYKEMIDIVCDAYKDNLDRESCEIMMKRGMKPANGKPGKFIFCRDPRLKAVGLGFFTQEQCLLFASKIKCQVMNIRASPGYKFDNPKYYDDVLDMIERSALKMERLVIEGDHHLHLTHPERIVEFMHQFLL